MAIYSANHSTVGKTTHAKGTAGAHDEYIEREQACRIAFGEHIPTDRMTVREWLDAEEEADRKNARVIDKFRLALPIELDQAQRVELVRAFVQELGGGVVPWRAAIHDKKGNDRKNPHCHLIIRDRHISTGKRAIGLSEKGSTEWAREIWEQVCNEALRDAGHSARVDRRSLIDQGITDRVSQGHEGPRARMIETKGKASDKLTRIREARKSPAKLHSALERASEREREAGWYVRAAPTPETATARSEALLIDKLRRMAERIWAEQRDKQAARRALRQKVAGDVGSRVFPDAITQHVEDISTIVFRRKPKQPMSLRDPVAASSGSQHMAQRHQPDQRSKFRLSF